MKVDIPIMKECPNYGHWKKMIRVWCNVTAVAKTKQAECILLSLDSDGQNLALQVTETERKNEDGSGVNKILERLDSLYEQNTTQQIFSAFEEFEVFKRDTSMSIAKYISEFDMKVTKLKDLAVNLPDSLLSYKLLKNANLSEDCTRIIRATCKELKLVDMKQAILNIFDVRLSTSGAGGSRYNSASSSSFENDGIPITEPFNIKTEPSDAFQSRYSERHDDNYHEVYEQWSHDSKLQPSNRGSGREYSRGRGRGRDPYPSYRTRNDSQVDRRQREKMRDGRTVNRLDRFTGKPSQCRLCGSIYHWARQCARNSNEGNYDKSNDTLQTQTIDIQLFAEQLDRTL